MHKLMNESQVAVVIEIHKESLITDEHSPFDMLDFCRTESFFRVREVARTRYPDGDMVIDESSICGIEEHKENGDIILTVTASMIPA